MDNKSLKVLEFDKVLSQLSEFGINNSTKDRINQLIPLTDKEIIQDLHNELDEAVQTTIKIGSAPITKIANIKDYINRARIDSVLNPGELLDISSFLKSVKNLIIYSYELDDDFELKYLKRYFDSLTNLNQLINKIEKKIKSDSEIADNASEQLAKIRREKSIKSKRIDSTLNKIINNPNNDKYLQEKLVSIRNGRYVIPVKAGYKNNIPGTIMDRSSTGATLFIEPLNVLELNNELNELDIEERKEIHKILRKLTEQIKYYYEELNLNYSNYLDLDFIFAKANYALSINANKVNINNENINLKKARHPLIEKDQVVASNITIDNKTKTLVITGPNTGGKTVSLKTIGLLTAMNQAGLFIPVNSNSDLKIFENIYADIGDEQSIEQNLSTFSSHLTNIVDILENNKGNALILFDELGAGTDPIEGAALAISILDYLKSSTNLTIATTHYPEIKEYALIEDQVENASVEFDVESLKPTYRLIIGIPGRSNAFEIAQRLGLSKEIINDSRNRMSQSQKQLSNSLDKAQEEQFKANKMLREAQLFRDEAENLLNKQKEEAKKSREKQAKILIKAKEDAKKILDATKKETDFIYREIQNIQNNSSAQINNKHLESLRLGLKEIDNQLDKIGPKKSKENQVIAKFEDFKVGDEVLVKSIDQILSVTNILEKEKKIEASSGSIRMQFKPDELLLIKNRKKPKTTYKIQHNTKKINEKLDLRGKSVSEAQMLLEDFINDALLLDMKHLEVIHGFGTGQIRNTVHNYLKKSKNIKSYRLGGPGEGGAGATIIEL